MVKTDVPCDDFDFDIVNFPFWMVTFLVVLLMVFTFRNLLGLLESAIMLQTSTLEINKKHDEERHYPKKRKIYFLFQNQSHRAYHFRRNKSICNRKM